jgi:NAD(P)-dependent dehydrogenase (short-subunit alcohol dehydrogenase family)
VDQTDKFMLTANREEGRVPQQGSIVNCASVNSIQAAAGSGAYTASKHGVVGITKTVSDDLARVRYCLTETTGRP